MRTIEQCFWVAVDSRIPQRFLGLWSAVRIFEGLVTKRIFCSDLSLLSSHPRAVYSAPEWIIKSSAASGIPICFTIKDYQQVQVFVYVRQTGMIKVAFFVEFLKLLLVSTLKIWDSYTISPGLHYTTALCKTAVKWAWSTAHKPKQVFQDGKLNRNMSEKTASFLF